MKIEFTSDTTVTVTTGVLWWKRTTNLVHREYNDDDTYSDAGWYYADNPELRSTVSHEVSKAYDYRVEYKRHMLHESMWTKPGKLPVARVVK
jgi:hypothetical protein